MAQAQANLSDNIIDLTGEDDEDEQFESLSKAASRAEAAANRLTISLKSMASASTAGHDRNLNDRNPSRSEAAGFGANDDLSTRGEELLSETRSGLPHRGTRSPGTGPRMGTFGLPGHINHAAGSSFSIRDRPGSPKASNIGTAGDVSQVRSPRAAAQSAGRTIAKTYDMLNPLEAQRDACLSSPKRPGRPKLDQWTPKWTSKSPKSPLHQGNGRYNQIENVSESYLHRAEFQNPASPSKPGSNESASELLKLPRPLTAPSVKRKRSNMSPQLDVPAKSIKRNTQPSQRSCKSLGTLPQRGRTTSSSESSRAAQQVRQPAGNIGKRDHGLLTPGLDNHDDGISPKQTFSLSIENGSLFKVFNTIVYPALKRAKKKATKKSLSEIELLSIGKSVAVEVVDQKLKKYISQGQLEPDDAQKEDLEEFVKKCFRAKVNEAVARSNATLGALEDQHDPKATNGSNLNLNDVAKPSVSIASKASRYAVLNANLSASDPQKTVLPPAPDQPAPTPAMSAVKPLGKITDLSGYLRKLENEVMPADLDEFNFTSPVRANASVPGADEYETLTETTSHQPSPPTSMTDTNPTIYNSLNGQSASVPALSPTSLLESDQAQHDENTYQESSFPADYDRGRYPAQRRRRANKYYTPSSRPSNSAMSNGSKPPVPAYYPDRSAPLTKPESSTMRRKLNTKTSPHISQKMITQALIARVNIDPKAKALLEAVAAEAASQSQVAELQVLTDELRSTLESQLGREVLDSTRHAMDIQESPDISRRTSNTDDLERSLSSSTADTAAASVISTEKGHIRLLKALANCPGDSSLVREKVRQENGRWIKDVSRSRPQHSHNRETDSSAPQPYGTLESSSFRHLEQGMDKRSELDAASQRRSTHVKKRTRPVLDATKQSQFVQQPPVSRLLATARDPCSERLIADILAGETGNHISSTQKDRHIIDSAEQEELLEYETVVRFADVTPRQRAIELNKHAKPDITRIETKVVDPARRPERHIPSLLRHRELGSDSRGRNVHTQKELCLRRSEMIEPWRYWKGASGDIVAAAWGSDSITYAVGAAAHTNSEDVQYNRPCNLLLGNLIHNTLTELPDHRVDRPKPETLAHTYNARQAVYEACDPMVYETVSSIAFSPAADLMYSASHDHTVKIWDTSTPQHCLMTLQHDAHVSSIEVSMHIPGLFATGSGVIENAVRIYHTGDEYPIQVFSSSRAETKPAWKIHPECLRWGSTAYTSHLLLAGFHQNDTDEPPQEGQLCLWDANASQFIKVTPSSQSVLAAAWHPTLNFFATGGAPGGNLLTDKYKTKTVVRTWDLRCPTRYTMEYECPALDMQDITFHPIDSNIVTAGCTDGTSFVWDYRRADHPLHRLKHGMPLNDWDHTRGTREEVDTGVMMSLWGPGGSLFYTGSSDGMIKAWDIRRHPQDVLVRNVAQFGTGVQSGAFSPDGTNLLVGDADGGVHVLSSAPCGPQPLDSAFDEVSPELPISLVRAPNGSGMALDIDDDNSGSGGREAAKDLTKSGQVVLDPVLGVRQGASYKTAYADHPRSEIVDPNIMLLPTNTRPENHHFSLREWQEMEEAESRTRVIIAARKQNIRTSIKSQSELSGGIVSQSIPKRNCLLGKEVENEPDRDGDYPMLETPLSNQHSASAWGSMVSSSKWTGGHGHNVATLEGVEPAVPQDIGADVEVNMIPESEMVEQNEWWPRLNEDEIEKSRKEPRRLHYAD